MNHVHMQIIDFMLNKLLFGASLNTLGPNCVQAVWKLDENQSWTKQQLRVKLKSNWELRYWMSREVIKKSQTWIMILIERLHIYYSCHSHVSLLAMLNRVAKGDMLVSCGITDTRGDFKP